MCNCSFCFEVYVNMIVFVAWYDISIFGCMHNLKQTYNSVLNRASDRGGEVGIPAQPAKDCKGNPGSFRFSVFRGGTFLPQTGN